MLIPRTAIFVRRGDEYLLLKGAPTKRLWAGKYNCLGGHVDRGEDILSSAKRELLEEAGISAELFLCGTVIVEAGENAQGEVIGSQEGTPQWVRLEAVGSLPVVEDLPVLLGRIRSMKKGDAPFSARSAYRDDKLVVEFYD
jgi:8-oxo-dGTP diphosphatase